MRAIEVNLCRRKFAIPSSLYNTIRQSRYEARAFYRERVRNAVFIIDMEKLPIKIQPPFAHHATSLLPHRSKSFWPLVGH